MNQTYQNDGAYLSAVEGMTREQEEAYLWETLSALSGCVFHTAGRWGRGQLAFQYQIRGGEMFIDRKEKSVTRASILKAYWKAREMGGKVRGPKALGAFGASYLYPVFVRLGVIAREGDMETLCLW